MWPESLRYLVLGAGGGGRTVAGILERALATEGIDAVAAGAIAFVDDRHPGSVVNGHRVIGTMADARQRLRSGSAPQHAAWIVAFGTTFMAERRRVFEEWRQAGARLFNAVDPSAAVDRTARIGVGNVVAAQSVIHPNAVVGDNCGIISSRAVVAQDTYAMWMGPNGFFVYDGFVKPIPCDLQDYVFKDLNRSLYRNIWALSNPDCSAALSPDVGCAMGRAQ